MRFRETDLLYLNACLTPYIQSNLMENGRENHIQFYVMDLE